MTSPEAIVQLARLVGRDRFLRCLGLAEGGEPATLSPVQIDRLRPLVDGCIQAIAGALLREAMASDDVQDGVSAGAYLDDRLAFLAGLLTPVQQERIRRAYQAGAGA